MVAANQDNKIAEKMTLHVSDGQSKSLSCLVKRSTPFKKIIDAFCAYHKLTDTKSLIFLVDGCTIQPHQTPSDFDMEDGDEIACCVHQIGG
mmetsp:Transcript_21879/g.30933  ORF Transcript_21879/g.30933 Transcript_21879/m.30933 type:complete len:91 (-) Transcript_21879:255-527(-)